MIFITMQRQLLSANRNAFLNRFYCNHLIIIFVILTYDAVLSVLLIATQNKLYILVCRLLTLVRS